MALIDAHSCECLDSSLDLFNIPSTQTSLEDSRYVTYHPVTSPSRFGPIEFCIPPQDTLYLDPSNIIFYVRCKILSENGDILAAEETVTEAGATKKQVPDKSKVCPINYFHSTQFKNVEIMLNGVSITANDNMYAYRAYLETLLSFANDTKAHQLKCAMYYQDTDDFDEHVFASTTENDGLVARFNKTKFSKPFETWGKIHSELTCQPKLLLPGCELRIRFHRADPKFCLISSDDDEKYSIQIDSAMLLVRHCKVSDSVREAHELALLKTNAKYPIRRIGVSFFTRGANRKDISEQNLCSGLLPRKIVFGIVRTESFSGDLHRNPFNFIHADLEHIVLRKNGDPVPFESINLDYDDNCHIMGYLSLLQATGRMFTDTNNGVDPFEDYPSGTALYGFDITPDESTGGNFQLLKEGKISLELKLKKAQSFPLTIVVYYEFDSLIQITHDRSVIYN